MKPVRGRGVEPYRAPAHRLASDSSTIETPGGPPMSRAWTTPLLSFTALALVTTLSGCNPRKAGTESASATTTSSAEGASANTGAIPVTAASDEARSLYLEGRALSEQLKAHDGRAKYEAAVAKDPSFAMAHYQLAVNSATAKDFFSHLKEAVALSDKASEGEIGRASCRERVS